jgi:hypothetical protein
MGAAEMSKKRKRGGDEDSEGLWIAQRYSMKGPAGDRAWENRIGGPPSNSKYLEKETPLGPRQEQERTIQSEVIC